MFKTQRDRRVELTLSWGHKRTGGCTSPSQALLTLSQDDPATCSPPPPHVATEPCWIDPIHCTDRESGGSAPQGTDNPFFIQGSPSLWQPSSAFSTPTLNGQPLPQGLQE